MAKKLINGCNQRDRATVSAPLTVPIRLLKFVHGSVRPARLRRVTRPGLLAILTLLGASGVVGVKAETFPFQIYGSAPAGLSRLSGFTDTIPDVVGRIESHASLVIFSEGNHFPVLIPLALDGFREWLRQKGHALRNDNVVFVTLPQLMLVSALERGGIAFGAAVVPVDRTDGLWPDLVMAGDRPLKKLASDGFLAPTARRFARNLGMSFLVRAGNPLGLHTVQDLADRRARVVLATSQEAGARQEYLDTLSMLAQPDAVRAILGRETSDFPGRLGIQHRDVPFAVANGLADAGLLVHHLALYYAETFPKEFTVVSLPGAEQRSADIYVALADHPRNTKAAAWFLEYFFSRAPEAYQANGFAKLPDAEFGETLALRPGR